MSDLIYPLALIGGELQLDKSTRINRDQFEAGTESRRAMWPDHHFRRRWGFTHTGLTEQEAIVLKEFYGDRNGAYDSFWFRDSVNRSGNHKVRFDDNYAPIHVRMNRSMEVRLTETSTRRSLPSIAEVTAAAGVAPSLFLDANREAIVTHLGSKYFETTPWDAASIAPRGLWYGTGDRFTGLTTAYSHYGFTGSSYALGTPPAGLTLGSGGALFVIARAPTFSSRQIAFSLGKNSAYEAIGLVMHPDNRFEPWNGNTTQYGSAFYINSAANTWRTFLINYASGGGACYFYVNGAFTGYGTNTAISLAAPTGWSLGAAPDASQPATVDIGCAIYLPSALASNGATAAPLLHNLFAAQYGLALV
jgi:hypothetical protein